jgi:hypothetical protein
MDKEIMAITCEEKVCTQRIGRERAIIGRKKIILWNEINKNSFILIEKKRLREIQIKSCDEIESHLRYMLIEQKPLFNSFPIEYPMNKTLFIQRKDKRIMKMWVDAKSNPIFFSKKLLRKIRALGQYSKKRKRYKRLLKKYPF